MRNLSLRSPDEVITTITAFLRNRSDNHKMNKTIQRSGQEQHRNLHSNEAKRLRGICRLCKNAVHNAKFCRILNTPRKKINRIKEKQLCFNCLSDEHTFVPYGNIV
uniref:RNAse_Pc domain-containing protein n=1 Tax=Heterorhabditis bacteriophora TaxID=37862 RepID=A0A1I7XRS7_HETBA